MRTGNKMAAVQLSDPSGSYEAVLFSEGLSKYRELLEPGRSVVVLVSAEDRPGVRRLEVLLGVGGSLGVVDLARAVPVAPGQLGWCRARAASRPDHTRVGHPGRDGVRHGTGVVVVRSRGVGHRSVEVGELGHDGIPAFGLGRLVDVVSGDRHTRRAGRRVVATRARTVVGRRLVGVVAGLVRAWWHGSTLESDQCMVRPAGRSRARSRGGRLFYWLMKRVLVGPLLHLLFRPWVRGIENVPTTGGAILASNHLAVIDSFVLPLVLDREIVFIGKSEYFTGTGIKGRLKAGFFRGVGTIPVDRSGGKASEAALHTGLLRLEAGGLFGIYPEGTRSPDGRLYRG